MVWGNEYRVRREALQQRADCGVGRPCAPPLPHCTGGRGRDAPIAPAAAFPGLVEAVYSLRCAREAELAQLAEAKAVNGALIGLLPQLHCPRSSGLTRTTLPAPVRSWRRGEEVSTANARGAAH